MVKGQNIGKPAAARREREKASSILQGKDATGDFDVFLCHNSADKPAVKDIGEMLKKYGILPWLDEWELRPGLPWQMVLEDQIKKIKSAAVFVGKKGIGPWQDMEMHGFLSQFVKRECPVIPVILPDCIEPPELPVFLKLMTWVDFRKKDPDPFEQLIWGITGVNPHHLEVKVKKIVKQKKVDLGVLQAPPVSLPAKEDKQIKKVIDEAQGQPSSPETLYDLGMLAAYRRDYPTALANFNRAIKQDPHYKQAYKSIAWLQQSLAMHELDQNRLDDAVNRLTAARPAVDALLQLDPLDIEALNLRGYIFKTLAQVAEARGNMADRQANYAEAARMFEHVVEQQPDDASAYNGLGNIYDAAGNYDKAIAAYQQAIRLEPKYTAAYHDLALAYEACMKAEPEQAAQWCKKALNAWETAYSLAPNDPGFTPDMVVAIGQRISWLKQECR